MVETSAGSGTPSSSFRSSTSLRLHASVKMRWPASLQFGTPLYVQAISSTAGKPVLSHALVVVPE